MQEIINSIRQNNNVKIKILVELKADIINNKIDEYADYSEDIKNIKTNILESYRNIINT